MTPESSDQFQKDMYRTNNGVITIPKAHSPNEADLADTLKIFPSPLNNQPPSIDVITSMSASDPIPIDEVACLVMHFTENERTRIENKAKFGALRDEKDMYKTKLMDNTTYKEDLRREVTMLKERSFAINETAKDREEIQQHLYQKNAIMSKIDQSREEVNSKLSQVEERNRLLRQKLAEKQEQEAHSMNIGNNYGASDSIPLGQPTASHSKDPRYSNQPQQQNFMMPRQNGSFQQNNLQAQQPMYTQGGMEASGISSNPNEIYDYINGYNKGSNGQSQPFTGLGGNQDYTNSNSQIHQIPVRNAPQMGRPLQGSQYPHQQQNLGASGASNHEYVNNPLLKKINF